MNKEHLYQPLMRRLPNHGHDNHFIVDGYSQELLLRIRDLMDVFAPIGDDHRHGLWIEVPRGKPSDWATFKEVKEWEEDVKTRKDYLEYWRSEFPCETYWYFISVIRYKGHTYLHISDHDHHWCVIHDDAKWNGHNFGPLDWYLEPLFTFLQEHIAEIVQNTEAYNRYVDEHLPKRQRTGSIPRKEMNRIVPWQQRAPKQLEKGLQMLRECIVNEAIYEKIKDGEDPGPLPPFYRKPLDTMSIRIYSKYFRVAHEVFDSQHEPWSERDKKEREQRHRKNAKLDDIGYYRRYQLGRHGEITDETDFDSVKAFEDMAFDHYGELGLSRMDVHATDYYTPDHWLITFGFSYSAYLDDAVDIAVALYETGCPLIIHDAQKILDVLEEKDNVLLTPHYFHDYFCHHDEGSVFPLPYECYLGENDELTREQYDEIVSLAEWSPEEPVVLDTLVPLDDSVYDLIRDEVSDPLTLCGILTVLERKYDVVFGISSYSDHQHCYLFEHGPGQLRIEKNKKRFDTVNAAMYYIISRFVEEKKKSKTK